MTILEAIALADALRPNPLPEPVKGQWLCELEMRTAKETGRVIEPMEWPRDSQRQLSIEDAYSYLYILHLCAMIDHALGEQEGYNQTVQLYNRWMEQYKKQQLRAETPPKAAYQNVWRWKV